MLITRLSTVLTFVVFVSTVYARRALYATSLVTCMANSQISPSHFSVVFDPDDRSLTYSLDLTTDISANISAHVQVYAYGFIIIEEEIDLCALGWKQFCPIFPGALQVSSVEYIAKKYIDMIPGIAFAVPDIDAVAKIIIIDRETKEVLSCLQSSFTNGKTISQAGAKWATAVIAGLGLLIAAIMSTFGNSNAASHIAANSVSLFLYFQSVVVVSMQHVDRVPPIASAWAANLSWSMGLIKVDFMQDIFRWYIQATGGIPTLYFERVAEQILVQRGLNYLKALNKRALDFGLNSNANLIVLRGIKRVGYISEIEPTSIVATGFTFFIIIGYVLIAILVLVKSVLELLVRFNRVGPSSFLYFRKSFSEILRGSLLRYIYIGFTQLTIFSLWEFTVQDSPAMIVLAVLFLILPISMIAYSFWQTFRLGRMSIEKYDNPAALLYGDSKVLNKYGYCYTMFHADKHWWGLVLIGYNLVKSIFVGLCQGLGKTSVLVLFILDLAYTSYLIYSGPYLNKPTNVMNYMIAVVTTLNSFFFLFFSELFGQPASVASIMAWVFFILNAAFSLILLVFIIVFVVMSVVSKNPDARFAPAKDDRFSFQRKSSVRKRKDLEKEGSETESTSGATHHNELAALGAAAQDHTTNWESEMYRLNELTNNKAAQTHKDNGGMLTPSIDQDEFTGSSTDSSDLVEKTAQQEKRSSGIGSRFKSLKRFSLKKPVTVVEPEESRNVSRLSDTLLGEGPIGELPPSNLYGERSHNRNESGASNISFGNGPVAAKGFI